MAIYALIMAGGKGERLWPLSRADRPKQFLPLLPGRKSLLQATFFRTAKVIGQDKVYVVTGAQYLDTVLVQLPEVQRSHVIVEPEGRDTAPCLALGTIVVLDRDPLAAVLALPADHYVADEACYERTLLRASEVATRAGYIVTIGMEPDRPETGYGYLLRGDILDLPGQQAGCEGGPQVIPAWTVKRFVEKPDVTMAERMLRDGGWYWNGGIFCYQAKTFLRLYSELLPQDGALLLEVRKQIHSAGHESVAYGEVFSRLTRISVDHGIMERAPRVAMVPGNFGWDDIGGWTALERIFGKDTSGNVVVGREPFILDTSDCIFYSAPDQSQDGGALRRQAVAAFGLHGAVMVDSGDVLLLTAKEHLGRLKTLLSNLRASGASAFLEPAPRTDERVGSEGGLGFVSDGRFVEKPWGYEIWWAQTAGYVGKILFVKQGERLSLQFHRRKTESMLCLDGTGNLTLSNSTVKLTKGRAVTVDPLALHCLEAETDLTVVEVSTTELDDVVRVSDKYGRAGKA